MKTPLRFWSGRFGKTASAGHFPFRTSINCRILRIPPLFLHSVFRLCLRHRANVRKGRDSTKIRFFGEINYNTTFFSPVGRQIVMKSLFFHDAAGISAPYRSVHRLRQSVRSSLRTFRFTDAAPFAPRPSAQSANPAKTKRRKGKIPFRHTSGQEEAGNRTFNLKPLRRVLIYRDSLPKDRRSQTTPYPAISKNAGS